MEMMSLEIILPKLFNPRDQKHLHANNTLVELDEFNKSVAYIYERKIILESEKNNIARTFMGTYSNSCSNLMQKS